MKKGMVMLLIAAMASMTLLGGCGKDETTDGSSASAESEAEEIDAETLLQATDYDVEDYVTLMDDYMNLSVELDSSYEVTDEDVQSYIENYLLPQYPIYTEGDKTTVEDGDVVNIDYEGTLDGEAFDGGTATGYNLTIGSDSFIDGFEDGLIGANVGDSLDLNLTFPESYSSTDLAGKDVVFHVTVNAIMDSETATLDTIDDDYVNENFYSSFGVSTVEELYSYLSDSLTSYYESAKQSAIQSKVLETLVEGSTVELPDGLLDDRTEQVITQTKNAAESSDTDYEDYISSYYGYDNEDDFKEYVTETLSEQLKQELILEAIVADQQTSINTDDFDSFVDYYVSYYGYDSAEDFYADYGTEEYVMLSYAENVVLQSIIDNTTTTVAESTDDADTATDDSSATEE